MTPANHCLLIAVCFFHSIGTGESTQSESTGTPQRTNTQSGGDGQVTSPETAVGLQTGPHNLRLQEIERHKGITAGIYFRISQKVS